MEMRNSRAKPQIAHKQNNGEGGGQRFFIRELHELKANF